MLQVQLELTEEKGRSARLERAVEDLELRLSLMTTTVSEALWVESVYIIIVESADCIFYCRKDQLFSLMQGKNSIVMNSPILI